MSRDECAAANTESPACIECVMAWLLYGDGAVCLWHQERVLWRGSSSPLTPGAGDATQRAKDAEPGTASDSPPCLIESEPVEGAGMNTNSPEFRSLLAAAIWWRDYATNLSEGRRVFPMSPYPALYQFTPAPPPGVVPQERELEAVA